MLLRLFCAAWIVLSFSTAATAEPKTLDAAWVQQLGQRVGARQDGTVYQHVIDVDPDGATATLRDAMRAAMPLLERGESVKVRLASGTYRETLGHVVFTGKAVDTPLAIVGSGPKQTVLSGADVFDADRWTDLGGGLYVTDWPHDWGNWAYPWETPGVLGHRSEMVFVNGKPMRPVLLETYDYGRTGDDLDHGRRDQTWTYTGLRDPATLPPGCFGVAERDDNGNKLYLRLPDDMSVSDAVIEVSTRRQLFRFDGGNFFDTGKHNLVLRGLTVQHFSSRTKNYGEEATIALGRTSRGVAIENCRFVWNSAHGLAAKLDGVTLRDCVFNYNGFSGIGGELDHALIERCTTSFNNWRGALGGQRSWWMAGVKLQRSNGNVVRRHTAIGNLAPGFWYDIQNTDLYLADCTFTGNDGAGLFLEISNGPLLAERIVSTHNDAALLMPIAGHIEVRDSLLHTASDLQKPFKDRNVPQPVVQAMWYLRGDEHVANEPELVPQRFELRNCTLIAEGERMQIALNNGVPRDNPRHAAVHDMYRGVGNTFAGNMQFGWVADDWAPVVDQSLDAWTAWTSEADPTRSDREVPPLPAKSVEQSRWLEAWVARDDSSDG